jgi:hypothetical protein
MAKLKSQGTKIQRLDTAVSPNAYADIGQVESISGPGGTATEIITTALDDTAVTRLIGLPDEGSVSLTVFWDSATVATLHAQLNTDRTNATLVGFRIRFTDSPNTTLTFNGYVQGRTWDIGVDDANRGTLDILVDGAVTLA